MSLISNQDFNSDALYLVFHDAGTALGRLDLSDNAVKERFGMLTITVTNLTSLIAYGTATIKQLAGEQT